MTLSDMMNIGLMQGFAGLSLFAVLLLMGLGLAIIFGQMGVINMAHGEFMTIGAYSIYLAARITESLAPAFMPYYFPIAIGLAFVFAFITGWIVEWVLIRHLYKRPLDTLLATWGVSAGPAADLSHLHRPEGSEPHAARVAHGLVDAASKAWTSRSTACSCWRSQRWSPAACCIALLQDALGSAGARHSGQPHDGQRHRHRHQEDRPPDLRHRLRHRRHGGRGLHHHRLDRADLAARSTSSTPSWSSPSAARPACSARWSRPSALRRRSRSPSSS